MLDATQAQLETFAHEACGDVAVSFTAPARSDKALQICFVLIGLSPNMAVRNDVRQPLQIYRRYLVCAAGSDSTEQSRVLEAMMFRALDTGIQIESGEPTNDLWLALGLPPQASFLIRIPVLRERAVRKVTAVQSVELQLSPTGTLQGVVLDSAGMPVANCSVEIPSEKLRATTDVEGRFKFQSLSRETSHRVRVVWKGKEFTVEPEIGDGFSEPLMVTLDSKVGDSKT